MEEIIKQAPEHISLEDIEVIFKKNNENVVDTLFDLWNIDVVKSNNTDNETCTNSDITDISKFKDDKNKWANIRNICDSYDLEMQARISNMRNKE
jgi:hypothetical protein